MSYKTITERITEIVIDQLCVPADIVTPDANFEADLGADSLDQVELIMSVEAEFDIEVPDAEAAKLTTVQLVIDYVTSRI